MLLRHRHTCMHLRRAAVAWAGSEVCEARSKCLRACCSWDSRALLSPLGSPWSHLLTDDDWPSCSWGRTHGLSCRCRQYASHGQAA